MVDIVGGIGVKLEPVVEGFKAEAEKQVNAAVPEIKEVQLSLDAGRLIDAAGLAKAKLTETRKELTEIEKKLHDLGEARRQAEAAGGPILDAFRRQQEEFAKDPQPTDEEPMERRAEELRRLVFVEEQAASAAKKRALDQLAADQLSAAGAEKSAAAREKEAVATKKVADEERRRTGIGGFLRAGTAGRSSGIAGLVGAGLRLGAVGIAATTAFQALGQLQQKLRVTGAEAFTAGGKFRNAAAELAGFNPVGAFAALTASRPVEIVGDLASKLQEAKSKGDPFIVTMEKLDALYAKSPQDLDRYVFALQGLGKISLQTALAMRKLAAENAAAAESAKAAALAEGDVARAIAEAGSEAAAFGERGTSEGRGVGGVLAERARRRAEGPTFVAGTGGTAVGNQIRASITSRIQDEKARLAQQVEDAKLVQAQKRQTFENVRHTKEAAGAWAEFVAATTDVVNATAAADTASKAAAENAQNLANSVRASAAAAIADPTASSAATLANAKLMEGQAKAAFDATKKGTAAADAAWAAWRIAHNQRVALSNDIAEQARQDAETAANEAQATKQAQLANAEAAAALTGNRAKQIEAITATRDYYRALAKTLKGSAAEAAKAAALDATARLTALKTGTSGTEEARLANELALAELNNLDTRPLLRAMVAFAKRAMDVATEGTEAFEQARGRWIQARTNLDNTNDTLNDLKRANARARAALTESEEDDERLIRAEIRRLEKKVKATKGLGIVHQRAIQELLGAESDLKGLVDEIKPTTTVFDLLTASTRSFTEHAGNLINARNRFTADSFTGGIRDEIGSTPNAAGRARLRLDDDAIRTSLDRNTVATDRLTAAFNRNDDVHGGGNRATPSRGQVVGMRYQAMADRYAEVARGARAGIS